MLKWFLWSMRPERERVNVTEPADGPVGRPAECQFFKVFPEDGNHR
jgi:hypothetical protein